MLGKTLLIGGTSIDNAPINDGQSRHCQMMLQDSAVRQLCWAPLSEDTQRLLPPNDKQCRLERGAVNDDG